MAPRQEEFELVLGNKQILSIFFLMVVLFAVFFSFGYSVGYNRGQEEQEQGVAALQPADEEDDIQMPDALLKDTPPLPEEPAPAKAEPEAPPQKQQRAATSQPSAAKAEKPRPFPEPKTAPPPPKKTRQPTAVTGAAVARSMHLQVAALRVRSDAAMLAQKLKAKGYPAVLFDQGGDGWHRVLVGPFRSEGAAEEYERKLKADGFDTILRKP